MHSNGPEVWSVQWLSKLIDAKQKNDQWNAANSTFPHEKEMDKEKIGTVTHQYLALHINIIFIYAYNKQIKAKITLPIS
jgi:hypothetical protein